MKINRKTSGLRSYHLYALFSLTLILIEIPMAMSQYFGRNRPSYRSFDYQVYESPNFEIYHYFENDSVVNALANSFEKWYQRHLVLFKDTFEKPSPIIIYQNHPEFQQTTAITGNISVGTQGVTEALKNRVVIPVLATNAQTDHVIGHELVHVFHFNSLFIDDSLSLNSLRNLPLWLVEGMAEYFSIGGIDANTSMIIRDAVQRDEFPTLKEMANYGKYNPYRYGHSFVTFVGKTWGDDIIAPLYKETAKYGYERAIERVIGLSAGTVADLWKSATYNHFEQFMKDSVAQAPKGLRLLSEDNSGRMNISPSISPDGKHIAFFSEKDLFSLDLFLAETETGKIIKKLSSSTRGNDIDAFNFFESKGTWSPDGKKFAHVAVRKGQNEMIIVDVDNPRRSDIVEMEGVPIINNPAWSPDGKYIVFSGLVEGITNLYKVDMNTLDVSQITNDRYSYTHPSWSPDGNYLTFATDRWPGKINGDTISYTFNLGIMHMQEPDYPIEVLDVFAGAKNVNPIFDADQKGLYFLSNRDGFRNLHYYELESGKVFKLTDFYTGINGITELSPAISVARETGEVAYTYFRDGKYSIYLAGKEDFLYEEVNPNEIDMEAATLPPSKKRSPTVVDNFLDSESRAPVFPVDSFISKEYKPRFGLTFIGSSGVGASTSRFGTGMSGGVSMMFSDMTGENQLFSVLAVNGEIYDFGGQVGYVNQKRRINWGGSVSHIPYPFAFFNFDTETRQNDDGSESTIFDQQFVIQRTFETQGGLFAFYPISTTRRIEMSVSHAFYYFRRDIFHTYYVDGFYAGQDRSRGDAPEGFNLQRVSLGYIGDNSYFGMASPMAGQRYRFSVERMFGEINMYNATADYRKYFYRKPFSVAFRLAHYGRYGQDASNNLFYPLFLGFPGYMRGFDFNALQSIGNYDDNFNSNDIQGTKMLLGGLELKVPFTGPERLAVIKSGIFFTELNWFIDAGITWNNGDNFFLEYNPSPFRNRDPVTGALEEPGPSNRFPVFSTGPSVRINLFGAIILEPYYAIPFTFGERFPGVWGLSFWPGW